MGVARYLLSSFPLGVCAVGSTPAYAQQVDFNIPAGSLQSALDAFARQSGKQVIYRVSDVEKSRSPGVRGRLTTDSALDALLAGTGLIPSVDLSGAIAILRPQPGMMPAQASRPDHAELSYAAIVVTGTRIRSRSHNLLAAPLGSRSLAPMTSVTGEQLAQTGRTAIGDVLSDLPALRSTLTRTNSTQIDTGAGLGMLDLRGLGLNRTLVLQNGRRHVPGATFTSAIDVSTIPIELIERVDIVTGGSSAVYGSDAIAGVVNFVLKRDFEGIQFRGQTGISGHSDAGQNFLSAVAGTNFADGRGNIAASLELDHSDDWYASDRAHYRTAGFYQVVDVDRPADRNGSDGNPDRVLVTDIRNFTSNGGTYLVLNAGQGGNALAYLFQPDGRLIPQTGERVGLPPFAAYIGGNGSNLREGKLFGFAPDTRRNSFDLLAHFTINDSAEPFLEAKFVRVESLGSSFGSFFSNGIWGPREGYWTDNPFLHPEARNFIRSTIGLQEGEERRFAFRRNFAELGPFVQHNRRETYRLVGGVRGKLSDSWSYEASANVAKVKSRTRFSGNVNIQRFLLAIDAIRDPSTGRIVCRSSIYEDARVPYENADPSVARANLARDVAECAPLDPFGEGNISPAARNYILQDGSSRSKITQTVLNAFATGDSRGWLELPGGPIEMVAGAEYRRETFSDLQDELTQSGLTHATPVPPFEPPAFSVGELFGEVRLPLMENRRFFNELTVSGAGRLASYRGGVGTVWAWNAGAAWAPHPDMRFRVNRSRAIRAPNLVESYQPIGQSFAGADIRDPCSTANIGAGSVNREANCRADGVPEWFNFAYPASFPYLAGGNPELHEESSDSLTFGGFIRPRLMPGFHLSIDYYDIRVKDVITSPSVQAILDACYDAGSIDNQFCALFERHSGPELGPSRELPGQIAHNSLRVLPLNYAALKVRGVDVEAAYRLTIPRWGLLESRLLYTLALRNNSFLTPEDPERADQNLLELGNPRHALSWDIGLKSGRLRLRYQLRYFSRMSVGSIENIRSVQGRPPQDEDAFSTRYFGGATYHAAGLQFELSPRRSAYVGVDNIADHLPPPSLTGVRDAGAIYDNVGRFFHAGLVVRF